jgi:hypothetical protein
MMMLEKAEVALRETLGLDWPFTGNDGLGDAARAVLLAIREPNEGMMKAMLASVPEGCDPGPFAVAWYAMIEAALAEPLPVSSGDDPTPHTQGES